MDKVGTKPLGRMSRAELMSELHQTRSDLANARQKIKDLQGFLDVLTLNESESVAANVPAPTHEYIGPQHAPEWQRQRQRS
jgi:hypothetical protein